MEYAQKTWFDEDSLTREPSRLGDLNKMFAESLDLSFGEINMEK